EAEARQSDPELRHRQVTVEAADHALRGDRLLVPLARARVELRRAHLDERELRRDEEPVQHDEQSGDGEAEHGARVVPSVEGEANRRQPRVARAQVPVTRQISHYARDIAAGLDVRNELYEHVELDPLRAPEPPADGLRTG